jgi:anti-sigma regulatory factor (Ser/Thr protein kinase)
MAETADAPITIALDPRMGSVVTAREALARLPDPSVEERRAELALLVTELVVNSVEHADLGEDDVIGLRVEPRPSIVHVEVSDPGSGFTPEVREPPPSSPRGRGLLLVDRIARRWGVRCDDRTRVWFDLDWPRPAM